MEGKVFPACKKRVQSDSLSASAGRREKNLSATAGVGSRSKPGPPTHGKIGGGAAVRERTVSGTKTRNNLVFSEVQGDLFSCPLQFSLAHCVSADLAMGKGIATLFKKKFGGVEELRGQGEPDKCLISLNYQICMLHLQILERLLRC